MHHSIWKILFVLGGNEYLERLAKLESAYSFMLKYSKITVWAKYIRNVDYPLTEGRVTFLYLGKSENGLLTPIWTFFSSNLVEFTVSSD